MFSEIYKWFTILCISIFIIPILAEWNTRDYIRREHSLTKPYQGWWPIDFDWYSSIFSNTTCIFYISGSGMSVPYWDFLGSTIVTSNYVRLTPDSQSKSGALWNTVVSTILLPELKYTITIRNNDIPVFIVWRLPCINQCNLLYMYNL